MYIMLYLIISTIFIIHVIIDGQLRLPRDKDDWERTVGRLLSKYKCPKPNGKFPLRNNKHKYYYCYENRAKLVYCGILKAFDGEWGCYILHEHRCPTMSGYYEYRADRSKYRWCVNQRPHLMDCTPGWYFESHSAKCSTQFTCPQPNGNYTYPTNRWKYYECADEWVTLRDCPRGATFNGSAAQCVYREIYGPCVDGQRGFAKPSNQSEYFECLSGQYVLLVCEYGLYYHDESQQCKQYGNVFHCPEPFGKFADPQDIRGLYYCFRGEWEHWWCRNSYWFDGTKCVRHYRCPKPYGMFPTQHTDHEYYECRKNITTLRSCPLGHRFNGTAGRCKRHRVVERPNHRQVIGGRIEFEDNGVQVTDVWDPNRQRWMRDYNGHLYEDNDGVFVPIESTAPDAAPHEPEPIDHEIK